MSYKQERVIVIVSEFVNDKREYYPITDVPVEKARFFYKDDDGLFKVMSSSDYAVRTETNETRLYITNEKIKNESSKFQMGYEINFSASEYETSLPVLSVLVEMYNTLIEDSRTIFNYIKKQCFISDDKTTGLILPNLPPHSVWCMGENNKMYALPVSELYGKFQQMINSLYDAIKKLLDKDYTNFSETVKQDLAKHLASLKNKTDEYIGALKTETDNQKVELDNYTLSKIEEIKNACDRIIGLVLNKLTTANTIEQLKTMNFLKVGDIVEVLGYYSPGDGANHKRIIKAEDDGSGVQLSNNLWACIVHNGEVNVSWFGAKGNGVTDDTEAIQKAIQYCLIPKKYFGENNRNSNIGVLKFDTKKYKVNNKIDLNINNIRTGNFTICGQECVIDFYGNELLYNNDKILNIKFSDMTFLGNDINSTLFNSISNGGAQRYLFDRCIFSGNMKYGINLKGGNNNSEFKFNYCSFSGKWNSFLNSSGDNISNQFLNYWFVNCIYWSSSQWIHLENGGHVKLIDCDISGYAPSEKTYLFYMRGSADGVQTFLDKGSRYELKSENACVLDYHSDLFQVVFSGSDFSSNVSFGYVIDDCFKFTTYNKNSVICKFEDCKLTGKFNFIGGNDTLQKCIFNNCIFNINVNKFSDNFNIKKGVNVSNTWGLIFSNCNYKKNNFTSFYPKEKRDLVGYEIINNFNSPFGSVRKQEFFVPFETYARCIYVKKFAYVGINYKFALTSELGTVTYKASNNIKINSKGASIVVGNKIITSKNNIYQIVSINVDTLTLNKEFIEEVGEVIDFCLLEVDMTPNSVINADNSIVSSSSTYNIISNIKLIDLLGNIKDTVAGQLQIITNSKFIEPKIREIVKELGTTYMATKMQQEGVYNDYISYMDEKTAYDKQQRKLEQDRQLAYEEALKENPELTFEEFMSVQPMILNLVEEPQPSEALKKFMDKYL